MEQENETEIMHETDNETKNELAEVFSRIAANIIDTLILFFIALIIVIAAIFLKMGWLIIFAYALVLVEPVYFIPFEMKSGQTPGKKILNIKVVDSEFKDIGFLKAFLRNITKIIPFWPLVGVILIGLTKNRQRLGDMLGGTLVIKANR